MMQKSMGIILAGMLCMLLACAGCTVFPSAAPVSPAATTGASEVPVTEGMTTTVTVAETPVWSGSWNTTWREKDGNLTVSEVFFAQSGSAVSGNYSFTYPGEPVYDGHLNGTVQGSTLAGMYAESDDDSGFFIFELSGDKNSFTGRWVHAANVSMLSNSTLYWNGVRA